MIPSITQYQIKYILALEKTGSFSRAAEQCFITQSTLSTLVRKVEDQIGLQIFDRKSKPVSLTKEGQILVAQLKLVYNEFVALEELIQNTKNKFFGTLRIGIIPTLAPFLLPLFLDKMIQRHPNINFSIDEITTKEISERIKTRELDIGILSLPLGDKGLIEKTLFHEEFLIYDIAKKFNSKSKYKIDEIDVNRLWLLEESHCMTNQVGKICHLRKNTKLNPNLLYNSGTILSLLSMVNMNNGITLLPRLATLQKKLVNNKFIHDIERPIPVREIGMITHPNFAKKNMFKMLENEICQAVKPYLDQKKKIRIINPL